MPARAEVLNLPSKVDNESNAKAISHRKPVDTNFVWTGVPDFALVLLNDGAGFAMRAIEERMIVLLRSTSDCTPSLRKHTRKHGTLFWTQHAVRELQI